MNKNNFNLSNICELFFILVKTKFIFAYFDVFFYLHIPISMLEMN